MIRVITQDSIPRSFYENTFFDDIAQNVRYIINNVRQRGDAALKEYCKKFDKVELNSFLIPNDLIEEAYNHLKNTNNALYDAVCYSKDNVAKFAKKQKEAFTDFDIESSDKVHIGQKVIPVEKAGVYIPGGRYPLISSVIMNVIPAKVAGVKKIILCTPPIARSDKLPYANENILATAYICGVDECYAVGGAQAIAAMAYGTSIIPSVNVITGPGNKYVAMAKKLVYGKVGLDMLAGPTEVFIMADSSASPLYVASDLAAQAEHDTAASSILVTDSRKFALKVQEELDKLIATLSTKDVIKESIDKNGYIILVDDFMEAVKIANKKAPEHLEVMLKDKVMEKEVCALLCNYGSLFIGERSAEVFGDYVAGINHTLPTLQAARYTGGLSVRVFLKTLTSLYTENEADINDNIKYASILAEAEGLMAHKNAAQVRENKNKHLY